MIWFVSLFSLCSWWPNKYIGVDSSLGLYLNVCVEVTGASLFSSTFSVTGTRFFGFVMEFVAFFLLSFSSSRFFLDFCSNSCAIFWLSAWKSTFLILKIGSLLLPSFFSNFLFISLIYFLDILFYLYIFMKNLNFQK